ncbi:MAG: C1 family peptidase [Bacteroidota bacterium]
MRTPLRLALLAASLVVAVCATPAQDRAKHDKALFVTPKNEFLDQLQQKADAFLRQEQPVHPALRADFGTWKAPASVAEFKALWHTPPVSQGLTGTCWCFSATSFFESEIHRQTGKEVKLSEIWTVYWEYVEKARGYVQKQGNIEFGEGSESNAVTRIWKKYGVVPEASYTGLLPGEAVHDHRGLFSELNGYLSAVKASNAWDETQVVSTVRSILDRHLGVPPTSVSVDGKIYSPVQYLEGVLKLKLDDYVEILSVMEKPYFTRCEYEVPDNWWHNADYVNVPLDDFMAVIKKALRSGYSVCIGGDTSEPGYEGHAGLAVVPSFDIPSEFIDESARQFRFTNHTTTDDHGIHIVGYTTIDRTEWFLIKDSSAGSRNNSHPGYYFYHEDFVKLKMMGFTVHKDMVEDLLKKVASIN